ncbi:S41 family peptidase [Mucilaginibacter calamicampi]|uniref:S41 family peptidase n=1 Tax=Mucilaginibacter calamicampi TaxID=1302352 RepID=A0ABW2YZJ2_9SPHI
MKKNAAIIFRSAILILLGVTIGLYLNGDSFIGRDADYSSSGPGKLSKVLDLVRNKYVDSVNVDSVEGETVNELLQRLDPHSLYLPAQQALSVNEKLEGGFNGIGIEYNLLRDTLVISYVYPDGPAAMRGLKAGDKVLEADHEKFSGTGLSNARINKKLRGVKGSGLLLSVLSDDSKDIKLVNLKRDRVTLSSIDAAYKFNPQTGYVKISKFATTTDADFKAALLKLKEEGLTRLVLDLRGNGGGYLNSATSLADEFLKSKQLIVYTKGMHEPRTDYFATDSGAFQDGKLAVLIDEYSASASEILAGALQDLDRAVIVGRRSFGKGLVQEQFQFDDHSAVNLTVARYYTASGRSIQKTYKNGVASYRNELAERMRKGELFSAESNLNDSLLHTNSKYRTSAGRRVFSGGGIMPDIFVPEDTTRNTWLISQLNKNDLFTAYVIDYLQPVLKAYNTDDDFINGYSVNDAAMTHFIKYASLTVKDITKEEIAASKAHLKTLLKANAAHFKWGDEGYYKALNATDVALKKAVESLN